MSSQTEAPSGGEVILPTTHDPSHEESNTDHRTLEKKSPRRPLLLHPVAGWLLVALLVALSFTLAGLTLYSQHHKGLFTIPPRQGFRDDVVRSIWSSGPTLVMMVVSAGILFPMALCIYLVAPIAQLDVGEATAEESIGANYANLDAKGRIQLSAKNKKWGLLALSITTCLTFWLDVGASGLIESRNTIIANEVSIETTAQLGLERSTDIINSTTDADGNYIFLNSDQYSGAVFYAGGQQLYRPSPTPFSYYSDKENWYITPFKLSNHDLQSLVYGINSSVVGNVTIRTHAINTLANCKMADSITFSDNNSSTAMSGNCSFTFPIEGLPVPGGDTGYSRWHFANSTQCQKSSNDSAFRSFIFATYRPAGYTSRDPKQFLVMFCQPTISVALVNATLSVSPKGEVGTLVAPPVLIKNFTNGGDIDDPSLATILGPPLNGMAVNGFDIAEPTELSVNTSRKVRAALTRSSLSEGIYGVLLGKIGTDDHQIPSTDWFANETNRAQFGTIVSSYYQSYINAFAPNIYYNTNTSSTIGTAFLSAPVARAWVSLLHAIGLGTLLFVLAFLMAITLRHQHIPRRDSHVWILYSGTILSHMTAFADHASNLIGHYEGWHPKHIVPKLVGKRFSIHERKLVIDAPKKSPTEANISWVTQGTRMFRALKGRFWDAKPVLPF